MEIKTLAKRCIEAIKRNNFIFIFGNGGSSVQSLHFSGELLGRFKKDRKPLPCISLVGDIAAITAIANDFGYENIFIRQLQALGKKGDIAIGLSTSGKSRNVNLALDWGKKNGLVVCDFERVGDSTAEIQENQLVALHELAKMI